uniref:Putative tail protein n=2 Tax=viral metagenome TaxID=1070528 RepID=A0A6M3KEN4_9ZZZZ
MSWLAGWKYRIKLTIDSTNIDSDLTWFPLMVRISASSGIGGVDVSAVFDELGTESLKIAVTQANGYTENYVEIEKWDSSGEDAILWVSKDGWEISSTIDTVLYLYYDADHADNTSYVGVTNSVVAESVWDSGFQAVWHMADGADNQHIYDSTSNDYDGIKSGAGAPTEVAGKIGNGQDFVGASSEYIDMGDILDSSIAGAGKSFTIEFIMKTAATASTVFGKYDAGGNQRSWLLYFTGNRLEWFSVYNTTPGTPALEERLTNEDIGTTNYRSIIIPVNMATPTLDIYVDGDNKETTNIKADSTTIIDSSAKMALGANNATTPTSYYTGIFDEVRVSSGLRSAAYAKAVYNTEWDGLITFSVEDTSAANYVIEVDWNNDGDFYDTYDDISSDIKSVSYSRGKSDELGKAEVGQLSITLNNADAKYTPGGGGVISASLLPKRPMQVWALYNGTKYDGFYGFIEEIIPHPHLSEQDCIITAVDGIDFLSRHDVSTALYKDAATGTIHGYILDDAGWSATMRSIDAGLDTVPYWYGQDVKARFAQEEIDDTAQGFSYISGNGYFNFEDRYHKSSATHQTSQATFTNTMTYITESLNPRNVYNTITATIAPFELQSEAELWRLEEVPSIDIGDTQVWWGEASVISGSSSNAVFVDAWVTPVSTTDYTANSQADGLGTDMTSDIAITTTKFAKTIKLSIKNNGTALAYITLLKARGTYYDDQTKVTRKAEDTTSQTAYQKRTLEIGGKYLDDTTQAEGLIRVALGKYKEPRKEIGMTVMNQDAATLTQILSLEISDRITVVNTLLGINADYFIDYMQHGISSGGKLHTVTYRLADCINEDFWCLDYSALASTSTSGQTKLGY